jgi:hypothetical protein
MWARATPYSPPVCAVGRDGFEPPKLAHLIYSQAQLSTLAPARAVPTSGLLTDMVRGGADDGTRTRNLLFTKQLLCQLSYVGKPNGAVARRHPIV